MEACLGLGRSQRNLNKRQQKDLKLQDQHLQQHTKLHQQKQQTQAIIKNQNYYTIQQNQRHLVELGQRTNVGALKSVQLQQNEESHLVRQQQQQNVQDNATPTSCTTTPKYQNTAATTTANMQHLSLSTTKDSASGVSSVDQQQALPQTISFQKNTVMVEVTPSLPCTVTPTNTLVIVDNENVRKRTRQPQQQQQQQKHRHHNPLHHQQQNEADLYAIEVCVDPEPHVSFRSGVGLIRQSKTLGHLNHQNQYHHSIEDQYDLLTNVSQITAFQLLQLQQQQQHDYSYAYYEPGAYYEPTYRRLSLWREQMKISHPRHPILLKGKKNKLLVSSNIRQSYQIRLTHQQSHNVPSATASDNCSNIPISENFYEEISASSTSSSSNSITSRQQLRGASHLADSMTRILVEEELRRVQNRHHKVLGELNLSEEAMLMPGSLPNSSPTAKEPPPPAVSVTKASGQPLRLSSLSADNICDTTLAEGSADEFISSIPNEATLSAGLLQSSCLAADPDSGFSGSSGASYIGSLRLHKTKALMSSRSNKLSSTATAAADSNAAANSQQSEFTYGTQCCRSFQRANCNNTNATVTATATTSSSVVPPQIHHNTKQQQQQLHMQHQYHQHHSSHLHHHHHHHLHQPQQHSHQQHQQSQCVNDVHNSTGFFTRASCGCRILNWAKIRAAEDPGPVVLNAQPNVSKARCFWNRKGWPKLPGSSTSSSSINDPG